ncbi:MAG: glycosyltransferase [Psychromonas sp.]
MYKYNDVSVIIPTFNNSKWIKSCIESVNNQTVQVAEIIIIDDGSNDDTNCIIQDYLDKYPYIRYVYQKNAGVSAARNTGINIATGKLVAFLDSDDLWLPEKTKKQIDLLNSLITKDTSFAFIDTFSIDYQNTFFGGVRCYNKKGCYKQKLLYNNLVNSTSTVICSRKMLIDAGGFDEKLRYGEDRNLWINLAGVCSMATFPEVLSIRRIHENNLSNKIDKNESTAENIYTGLVPKLIINETELREVLMANLSKFLILYAKNGDTANLRRLFLKLFKMSPKILLCSKGRFFIVLFISFFGKNIMMAVFRLWHKSLQIKNTNKYSYLFKYVKR